MRFFFRLTAPRCPGMVKGQAKYNLFMKSLKNGDLILDKLLVIWIGI